MCVTEVSLRGDDGTRGNGQLQDLQTVSYVTHHCSVESLWLLGLLFSNVTRVHNYLGGCFSAWLGLGDQLGLPAKWDVIGHLGSRQFSPGRLNPWNISAYPWQLSTPPKTFCGIFLTVQNSDSHSFLSLRWVDISQFWLSDPNTFMGH